VSQQNVEIVRAVIDAYNREDWDAGLRYAASGAQMDFESIRVEVDRLIDAGEHVVLLGTVHSVVAMG
jgi:hypothetical protein